VKFEDAPMELSRAVAEAVNVVNSHQGETTVWLRFAESETEEFDFVANAAKLTGNSFEFMAGYDTFAGTVDELKEIRVQVIPA
jgi:hypothetical protein